jgi:hypothetical protein
VKKKNLKEIALEEMEDDTVEVWVASVTIPTHEVGEPDINPMFLEKRVYAHRCYREAIDEWEHSRTLDGHFPTVHRNLRLAYFNMLQDPQRALKSFETAFQLNHDDARVLFEFDQL